MVVLRNFARLSSCRLFLPAKTGRIPEFKIGDIEASWLPLELAKFLSIRIAHDGHYRIESDAVALVTNAAHRHQWPCDSCDLEDGLQVTVLIREVQRALAQVRDGASIAHEEFLSAFAPRRLLDQVSWNVARGTYVYHRT